APPVSMTSGWLDGPQGVVEVGHAGDAFAFDNETPRHATFLAPYRVAESLVSNEAWLAFMASGAYDDPLLWMSEGWALRQAEGWTAPLYWEQHGGEWMQFDLGGLKPVDPTQPVRHVSWYEADAFARWAG